MLDLIVLIPGHCLSIYCKYDSMKKTHRKVSPAGLTKIQFSWTAVNILSMRRVDQQLLVLIVD